MNQQQASALLLYLNRAVGIVPTTGLEWARLQGGLAAVEGVANGLITLEAKPIEPETKPVDQTKA
jgi:hypothetical protein